MTTRRLLATLTMFALLCSLIPLPVIAADNTTSSLILPAFNPTFSVVGTDARYAGASLVVAEKEAALAEYDAETGTLVRKWPLDAPAVRLASDGILLALTSNGSLYCFRPQPSDHRLALEWKVLRNSDKAYTADQTMLVAVGKQYDGTAANALVALGNQVYLVNLINGKIIWQKALPTSSVVRDVRELAGRFVIHYQTASGSFITVWNGLSEVTTFPVSPITVRDARTTVRSSFLYVNPDGRQIHEVDIYTLRDQAILVAGEPVQSITQGTHLVVTAGDYSYNWQDGVKSWYNDETASHGSYPLLEGYLVVSAQSVALLGVDQLSWATELAGGDETTTILDDQGWASFALKLNQDTIVAYSQSESYVNSRQLAYAQGHIYHWQHPQAGPVSLDLSLGEYNPYFGMKFTTRYQAEGSNEWTLLEQGRLEDFVTTLSYPNVPAGQVKITITPSVLGNVNPELLPASDEWAHRPLTYGINLREGLQGSLAAPPLLRAINPGQIPHDLWNAPDASSLVWQVQTDPDGQVDFLGLEHLVQADAAGTLYQTVPLEDQRGQSIQAIAGDETGSQSSLSIWVYRHLIKADPRVAPQLSRQPAIVVSVPDAASFDLTQSEMLIDGVRIPLYANLQTNQIYGVPTASLPTGIQYVSLALRGPAATDGSAGQVLDWAEWPLEIIGYREAILWPNNTNSLLNGYPVKLDAAAYVDKASSSTMIPFRYVGDVMGAQVGWNNQTKQVTFKLEERTVLLTIGSRTAYVNGQPVTMLASPTMQNGRTLVPLRFVSEQLGATVDWNGSEQQITIIVQADPAE